MYYQASCQFIGRYCGDGNTFNINELKNFLSECQLLCMLGLSKRLLTMTAKRKNRKEELLDATVQVVASGGSGAATVRAIAREAGVTDAALPTLRQQGRAVPPSL